MLLCDQGRHKWNFLVRSSFILPFFLFQDLRVILNFHKVVDPCFWYIQAHFFFLFFFFSFLVLPYMKGDNKSTSMQAYFNKLISRLLKQMEIINHINSTNWLTKNLARMKNKSCRNLFKNSKIDLLPPSLC